MVERCALSGSDLKIKFRTILLTSILVYPVENQTHKSAQVKLQGYPLQKTVATINTVIVY